MDVAPNNREGRAYDYELYQLLKCISLLSQGAKQYLSLNFFKDSLKSI